MSFTRTTISSCRKSWGPTSLSSTFHRLEPDEEFAEECTERMISAQMRQLDPLKEDLAEWLNKTLGELVFFFLISLQSFRRGKAQQVERKGAAAF